MLAKLKSRKFWITVATGLLVVLNDALELGLSPDAIGQFVIVAAGYLVAQGIADHNLYGNEG